MEWLEHQIKEIHESHLPPGDVIRQLCQLAMAQDYSSEKNRCLREIEEVIDWLE